MPYIYPGTRVYCNNLEIEGVRRGTLMSRNGEYHSVLLDNGVMVERYSNELDLVKGTDLPPDQLPLRFDLVADVNQQRRLYVESLVALAQSINTRYAGFWQHFVRIAMDAGLTVKDINVETGATPATVKKWLDGTTVPREGTRRLMKSALLLAMRQKETTPFQW